MSNKPTTCETCQSRPVQARLELLDPHRILWLCRQCALREQTEELSLPSPEHAGVSQAKSATRIQERRRSNSDPPAPELSSRASASSALTDEDPLPTPQALADADLARHPSAKRRGFIPLKLESRLRSKRNGVRQLLARKRSGKEAAKKKHQSLELPKPEKDDSGRYLIEPIVGIAEMDTDTKSKFLASHFDLIDEEEQKGTKVERAHIVKQQMRVRSMMMPGKGEEQSDASRLMLSKSASEPQRPPMPERKLRLSGNSVSKYATATKARSDSFAEDQGRLIRLLDAVEKRANDMMTSLSAQERQLSSVRTIDDLSARSQPFLRVVKAKRTLDPIPLPDGTDSADLVRMSMNVGAVSDEKVRQGVIKLRRILLETQYKLRFMLSEFKRLREKVNEDATEVLTDKIFLERCHALTAGSKCLGV